MKIITRREAKAQGLKRYFTGKPCKWGHVGEYKVSSGGCVECAMVDNRQYRAENRDRDLERKRQYRQENRERILEKNHQHYADNREYYLECHRRYRKENRDKVLERNRNYRKKNPEKRLADQTKRYAAKMDRTLSHDEELTQFVMEEAAQQARDMEETFGMPFHVDHMIPMQGNEVSGLHVWYNLQILPASLNISKGNRMIYTEGLEWLSGRQS